MAVVFVLLASLLVFRDLGMMCVVMFATWKESTRYALAFMFSFTSGAITKTKHDLAKMVPKMFPQPLTLVYFTEVCEVLGAVGILVDRFRPLAGSCLVLLLIPMFPANVKAASRPATPRRGFTTGQDR